MVSLGKHVCLICGNVGIQINDQTGPYMHLPENTLGRVTLFHQSYSPFVVDMMIILTRAREGGQIKVVTFAVEDGRSIR